MSVFDSVRTLLAVREYTSQSISDESLHKIIEAGRLSASARNRQPWHFVVVDEPNAIREVAALAKTGPYIAGAPVAIVVAVEKASPWAVADASRAIQSMVLTAWEEGIGSNWVGFGGLTEIAALLQIPDTYDVLAVLPFGYPVTALGKGEKVRKPLDEVASRGVYGNPFA